MISNFQITDDTPVSILTVGQQKELFRELVKDLIGAVNVVKPVKQSEKRYVYGIAGIATLFQVSYVTASKLKDGVLKPAIFQQGRKIMCDVDMAMELFRGQAGK